MYIVSSDKGITGKRLAKGVSQTAGRDWWFVAGKQVPPAQAASFAEAMEARVACVTLLFSVGIWRRGKNKVKNWGFLDDRRIEMFLAFCLG